MSKTLSSVSPRQVADDYVEALVALDPATGSNLGVAESHRRLPDPSPDGQQALADLALATLRRLDEAEARAGTGDGPERRCGRLLRERLTAQLAVHDAGEGLCAVSNLRSPVHTVRKAFTVMPTETEEDWAAVAERLDAVGGALEGYRAALTLGLERSLHGGPRAVGALIGQLTAWAETAGGWFQDFAAAGPDRLRTGLDAVARRADDAVGALRDWLRDVYAPAVEDSPDTVGRDRYALWARQFNGADLDPDEAYAYGWSEYHRLLAEMRREAARVLPGAGPWEALAHLDEHGVHIEGVAEVRAWLQELTDETITALDGTQFDLAERVKRVEVRIAPTGSAAAPYYTAPSEDFSRPGRTWLPTMGATRFPVYDLTAVWYHEGVPGHHLQLAQWRHVADRLSRYQATVGVVGADTEGWALYAERLMDELGFFTDAERRLGYLDGQMMRAVRVIIDIGMHLRLEIPAHSPFHPGERWTPALAQRFLAAHCGRPADFLESEMVRYLSVPAQAIGYKLGERAWLLGRERARAARGGSFDARAWHMAALSQGSLGLDDLVEELGRL
ncbi:DUF885 domain-containing protein [Streptomyces alboverticillatus]|uniref:DUF885 domain-containing protein n=1 Tax=Streptomyces alboverticillatus TaxID=173770 RepID=UPI000A377040|nr:DUF885 domain-containing protein [Streptomyces alboverticillatus]